MRKWFVFFLLVSLLLFPTLAEAQSEITIKDLSIQFWPEYDHPDMLVMYSFALAEDSTLPAEFQIRVPANADLNAIAKASGEKMVNVPYDAPIKDGDWSIITIVINDLANYRVEYYVPLKKNGSIRNFSFLWQSDYAVESFKLQFQQPPSSTNLVIEPVFSNANPMRDGIVYHDLSLSSLPAGEVFELVLSYDKASDDLTVSSMPVEVGGVQKSSEEGSFSLGDSLPKILVCVGVFLIAGGVLYFFLAGRRGEPKPKRKRHTPSTTSASSNVYCHECGKRARSGDKFCRSCGAKMRL